LQLDVLQHAEMLPMESLSDEETRQLLAARYFGVKVRIQVGLPVAREVHSRTGGNPYWTSMLAGEMWDVAPVRRDGSRLYNLEVLAEAEERLYGNELVFRDRLTSPVGVHPGLVEELLATLAAARGDGEGHASSPQALLAALQGKGFAVTAPELVGILKFLEEQGSVTDDRPAGRSAWRISAPLLAGFLRYRRSAVAILAGDAP
jgi:hypothetical protein